MRAEKQGTNVWPTFNISGVQMQTLVISDWSLLWSIEKIKKYILEPSQVSAYAAPLSGRIEPEKSFNRALTEL